MALTATQQARLERIDQILALGLSSVTTESGRTNTYNLAELRQERDELRALATAGRAGSRLRRVTFADG